MFFYIILVVVQVCSSDCISSLYCIILHLLEQKKRFDLNRIFFSMCMRARVCVCVCVNFVMPLPCLRSVYSVYRRITHLCIQITSVQFLPENEACLNHINKMCISDVHWNGIPNGTGNPMGIPWEWE